MKKTALLILVAILSGCASLPPEYAKAKDRGLVVGETVNGVQALIRSIDDGEVLFVRGYNLGNKVWLKPGSHTLSISCVKTETWGSRIAHTTITLDVKKNHTYELEGIFLDKTPIVLINDREPGSEGTLLNLTEIEDYVRKDQNKYISAAKNFVLSAQNSDLKAMIDLTSPITIKETGNSRISEVYTQQIIPAFQGTTVKWDVSIDIIMDDTGNLGAVVSGQANGPEPFPIYVTVMKEDGKFVVITASRKQQPQAN